MNQENLHEHADVREPKILAGHAAAPAPANEVAERHRSILSGLADQLIPAGDRMPSATAAGVTANGLDVFLRSRPELAPRLRHALESVADLPPDEALARLRDARDDESYVVITEVAVGAYFMNPEILARLGYPGQRKVRIPEPPLDPSDEELVRSVVSRGPIYREC